jgi:hypothetical protein
LAATLIERGISFELKIFDDEDGKDWTFVVDRRDFGALLYERNEVVCG